MKILKLKNSSNKKREAKFFVKKSNDPRSYRQDSSKLLKLGFKEKYSVNDAIEEIIKNYRSKKLLDKPNFIQLSG